MATETTSLREALAAALADSQSQARSLAESLRSRVRAVESERDGALASLAAVERAYEQSVQDTTATIATCVEEDHSAGRGSMQHVIYGFMCA